MYCMVVLQSADEMDGPLCELFSGMCKFCGDTCRQSASTNGQTDSTHSDQSYCCSKCCEHVNEFISQGDSPADTLMVTDADDVTAPASAPCNDTLSPRYLTLKYTIYYCTHIILS